MRKFEVGFPDEFAHPNVKKGLEWGLQAAKAIWDYGVHYSGWSVESRRERFHENRLLSQGLQGQDKYKKAYGDKKGNVKYMHMFWKETSPLPKYIRSTIKSLIEAQYEPTVTAFDATSQSEKDDIYNRLKANLYLQQIQDTRFRGTGINLVPKGEYVPQSNEEIEIRKNIGFKVALEIAQQLAIKVVFNNNNVELTKKRTAGSLTINQWAAVRTYYDQFGDIAIDWIDERDLIVPYSDDEYFEDKKFTGFIKRMTISEIRGYNAQGDKPVYNDYELFDMARGVAGKFKNGQWDGDFNVFNHSQRWNTFSIDVLVYEINTVNKEAWLYREKPDGRKVVNPTKPHSKKKKSDKKETFTKERQVWYDGMWVVGSEKMLQHKLRENEVYNPGEDGFYEGKPKSQFIVVAPEIYQMRNKAIPESAEVYVDNMHKALLKYQQFLNSINPPTKKVNIDSLTGVLQKLGIKDGKPMDIELIAKQTQVHYYSNRTVDGQLMDNNPVADLPNDIRNQIYGIVELYNQNLYALESELGINDAMIGQTRNKYEGLGSREQKLNQGVKALSHLQTAQDYIWDRVLENVSIMVQDTLASGDKVKGFENAIGKENVKVIKLQDRMTNAELGCKNEMLPTDEDKFNLLNKLEIALQQQTIELAEAMRVEQFAKTDTKLAFQYMVHMQQKYSERRMQEAHAASQSNSMQQQESAAMAAEMQRQRDILLNTLEIQKEEYVKALEEKNQQAKFLDDYDLEKLKGRQKLDQIREANAIGLQYTESNNNQIKQPKVFPKKAG